MRRSASNACRVILGGLEANRPSGLALPDIGAVNCAAIGCHKIAAAPLAIDGEIDSAKIRTRCSSCNLARMDQTWPTRSGGLLSLPLALGVGAGLGQDKTASLMGGLPG